MACLQNDKVIFKVKPTHKLMVDLLFKVIFQYQNQKLYI